MSDLRIAYVARIVLDKIYDYGVCLPDGFDEIESMLDHMIAGEVYDTSYLREEHERQVEISTKTVDDFIIYNLLAACIESRKEEDRIYYLGEIMNLMMYYERQDSISMICGNESLNREVGHEMIQQWLKNSASNL